jgi:glycosyltransferase involved in cell wall biosynthesis
MKVDLTMWTKNAEQFLPVVLKRIDDVILRESVHRKILIDDHSVDDTVKIAKEFNWEVFMNPSTGVASGANEALRHVDCEFFVSIEQDVVLAKDWWIKVPPMLGDKKVAVASGVRIPDKPIALMKLHEYTMERYCVKGIKDPNFHYGKTIDNTIYKTKIIKKIGGFPKLHVNVGVDNALARSVFNSGYLWAVNWNVKSIHLRGGLQKELEHSYWYGSEAKRLAQDLGEKNNIFISTLRMLITSPLHGLKIGYRKRCWQILYVYPLLRAYVFIGVLKGCMTS